MAEAVPLRFQPPTSQSREPAFDCAFG